MCTAPVQSWGSLIPAHPLSQISLSLHHLTKFYCLSKALSKRSPDKPLYFPFSCPHSTWGGPLCHASQSRFTSKEAWMRKAWQYRDTLGSDAAEVNVDRAWDTMQGKDPCASKGRTMWTCTGKWVVSVTIQIWTLTIWDWASRVTKHSGTGEGGWFRARSKSLLAERSFPQKDRYKQRQGYRHRTRDHPCPQGRNAGLKSFITQRTEKKVPTTVYLSILNIFRFTTISEPHRLCLYPCRADNWRRKIQIEPDDFSFSIYFSKIPSKGVKRVG